MEGHAVARTEKQYDLIIFEVRRMEIIMNVFDTLKDFFMPADESESVTSQPKMSEEEDTPSASSSSINNGSGVSSASNGYGRSLYEERERKNERYATIKTTAQFQVVLVKATAYTSDSKKVADYLMQNKTVVLNLEEIQEPDKRRIVDFVVGAAYAMHGRIRPIANQTFLIIPQNVGFDGDSIVGELQDNGLV